MTSEQRIAAIGWIQLELRVLLIYAVHHVEHVQYPIFGVYALRDYGYCLKVIKRYDFLQFLHQGTFDEIQASPTEHEVSPIPDRLNGRGQAPLYIPPPTRTKMPGY